MEGVRSLLCRCGAIRPRVGARAGCGGEWFALPVPRLFLCVGALHPIRRQCTSSVRVQCPLSGVAPPRLWRLSGLWGSSGLELSSAWGLSGTSCCFLRNVACNSPARTSNVEIASWNCNVFGCCRKFGHPNCMRVLVDEAPKANSCVRSSSHDTVHDPRDASNTTPTPHNAKSHETPNPQGRGFTGRDFSLPLTSELLRGPVLSGFAVTNHPKVEGPCQPLSYPPV